MIRQSLRGKAEILMGKNTLLRKIIRFNADKFTNLEGILSYVRGNTGFVFTHLEVPEIRRALMSLKVQRAAKVGDVAPVDVTIAAGDTHLEPTKTSFFQALGIPSKINKGSISLSNEVHLLKAGQRVTLSQAALLKMLNIRPFHYGVKVGMVYDSGDIYPSASTDLNESTLMDSILKGIANVAAVSVEIGHPTLASVSFAMRAALHNVLGVAVATGMSVPQLSRPAIDHEGMEIEKVVDGDDDNEGGETVEGNWMDLFGDEEEEEDASTPAVKPQKKPTQGDDGEDPDDPIMPTNIFGEEDEDY